MTFDVSAAGTGARLVASETFPNGFDLTSWADDSDPFDIPALTTASQAMNVNGDMVTWSTPAPIVVTINVLPARRTTRTCRRCWTPTARPQAAAWLAT